MTSVHSWFHLPKILFSSLHLKLFDIAQRWAHKDAKHMKLLNLLCIVYFLRARRRKYIGVQTVCHLEVMTSWTNVLFLRKTFTWLCQHMNLLTSVSNNLDPDQSQHSVQTWSRSKLFDTLDVMTSWSWTNVLNLYMTLSSADNPFK